MPRFTAVLIVRLEVNPEVNVRDKTVSVDDRTDALFPAPSKVTSSELVGAATRTAPPEVALQFVVGLAFQFVFVPPPIQNLAAITVFQILFLLFRRMDILY